MEQSTQKRKDSPIRIIELSSSDSDEEEVSIYDLTFKNRPAKKKRTSIQGGSPLLETPTTNSSLLPQQYQNDIEKEKLSNSQGSSDSNPIDRRLSLISVMREEINSHVESDERSNTPPKTFTKDSTLSTLEKSVQHFNQLQQTHQQQKVPPGTKKHPNDTCPVCFRTLKFFSAFLKGRHIAQCQKRCVVIDGPPLSIKTSNTINPQPVQHQSAKHQLECPFCNEKHSFYMLSHMKRHMMVCYKEQGVNTKEAMNTISKTLQLSKRSPKRSTTARERQEPQADKGGEQETLLPTSSTTPSQIAKATIDFVNAISFSSGPLSEPPSPRNAHEKPSREPSPENSELLIRPKKNSSKHAQWTAFRLTPQQHLSQNIIHCDETEKIDDASALPAGTLENQSRTSSPSTYPSSPMLDQDDDDTDFQVMHTDNSLGQDAHLVHLPKSMASKTISSTSFSSSYQTLLSRLHQLCKPHFDEFESSVATLHQRYPSMPSAPLPSLSSLLKPLQMLDEPITADAPAKLPSTSKTSISNSEVAPLSHSNGFLPSSPQLFRSRASPPSTVASSPSYLPSAPSSPSLTGGHPSSQLQAFLDAELASTSRDVDFRTPSQMLSERSPPPSPSLPPKPDYSTFSTDRLRALMQQLGFKAGSRKAMMSRLNLLYVTNHVVFEAS